MEQQVIAVHYQQMEEWLSDRRAVLGRRHRGEYARLMELAPKLVQLVRYEIPALHKQQKRASTALDDAYRAIEETAKLSQSLREKRSRLLRKYGLENGESAVEEGDLDAVVDARIASSTTLLQETLKEFALSTHLAAFRETYDRVAKMYSMGMYVNSVFSLHLPWLDRLFEERHCTLGVQKDCHQQQQQEEETPGGEETGACGIDWGDMDAASPIDMDAAVEIKWVEEFSDTRVGDNGGDNAKIEESGNDTLPEKVSGIFSIDVSNVIHRQHIITELQALLCFASERSLMDDELLTVPAAAVDAIVKQLTTSNEAAFVRMKTIPSLRLSLLEEIQRLEKGIASAAMRRSSSEGRLQQMQEELQQLEPQMESTLNAARTCRDECLAELVKMFPGQTVTIVGDINKYL